MIDEHLEVGSVIDQHYLDSDGPSTVPTGPADAGSASETNGICHFNPHTEEVATQYGRVTVYKYGAHCPVVWDPHENRWRRGPQGEAMTELVGTQSTDEAKPEENRVVINTDGEARRNSGAAKPAKKRRKKSRFVQVGALPVDAGMMMLSDPCYVLPDPAEPDRRDPKIYERLCEEIGDKPYVLFNDSALVAKTGYGDGIYPVFAELDENDRVMAITISFQPW
jgi:hypothetical protein